MTHVGQSKLSPLGNESLLHIHGIFYSLAVEISVYGAWSIMVTLDHFLASLTLTPLKTNEVSE